MATLATLRRRVAALGATLDDDGSRLRVTAPSGKRFASEQVHEFRLEYYHDFLHKSGAYTVLLEDLEMGVEPCDEPDCEWCNDA